MANTLDIHDLRYVNIIRDYKKRPRVNFSGEIVGFYYAIKLRVMKTITYETNTNAGYVLSLIHI